MGRVAARRGGVLVIAGVLLLGAAAAVYVLARPAAAPAPAGAVWEPGAPETGTGAGPTRDPAPDGPPTRLRIPVIGVDARLEPLHLDAKGVLEPPKNFALPGWYAEGTPPGDVGPAVIGGHVDSKSGPAVFYQLAYLRPGDRVEVARGDGWITFRVVKTGRYAKNRFPTAQVYGSTPDPQLRLITCGGEFDKARNSYRDNIVVYAVAA